MTREEILKKARENCDGCTLFENREKTGLEFLEEKKFQIDKYYYLNADKGGYYVFTIVGDNEHVFLSNKAITDFISDALIELREIEQSALVTISLGKAIKLRNSRTFRPIKILD